MQATHAEPAASRNLTVVPRATAAEPDVPPPASRSACSSCRQRNLCLAQGLCDDEMRILDNLMIGRRRLRKGEALALEGQPVKFLYAVRMGSFKSSISMFDGSEHVAGFAFPGDVLGFDGLADSRHATTATALEDSEACVVPLDALLLQPQDPRGTLVRQFHRKMAAALVRDHDRSLLLADSNAEPRVAAFLLMVSRRMRERGWSACEFNLRMSRAEIGSYLGVTLETVSRALSAFAQRGWIEVRKRRLRLLDLESLARTCDTCMTGLPQPREPQRGKAASQPVQLAA